jgi:hypothetical protein
MSEPQNPDHQNNPTPIQSPDGHPEKAEIPEVRPKTHRPKPLPDWKPLGAVQDYFTEQMRQDSIYRY